ncbi:hypothetical protein C8R45DRAFT_938520 [Mycena sanguinolenta]|nr:hypothetical protein C8R45DRAFT_938520 [Mycena sanguinolenta]
MSPRTRPRFCTAYPIPCGVASTMRLQLIREPRDGSRYRGVACAPEVVGSEQLPKVKRELNEKYLPGDVLRRAAQRSALPTQFEHSENEMSAHKVVNGHAAGGIVQYTHDIREWIVSASLDDHNYGEENRHHKPKNESHGVMKKLTPSSAVTARSTLCTGEKRAGTLAGRNIDTRDEGRNFLERDFIDPMSANHGQSKYALPLNGGIAKEYSAHKSTTSAADEEKWLRAASHDLCDAL